MLPHLADQLGNSIPVLFATSIVELLDIIRRFYRVGLELHKENQQDVWAKEAVKAKRAMGKGRGGGRGKAKAKANAGMDQGLLTMLPGLQKSTYYEDLSRRGM